MNELVVKSVDVLGDTIMAARSADGNIYAGISYFCNALGMSKGQKDRQVKNVQKDKALKKGCVKFDAGVLDAMNESVALRIDFVPLWLAKISITDKMEKEHPELANKLLDYQLKAKDILAEAFLPSQQEKQPLTLQQQIQTIAKGTEELYQRMDVVDTKVDSVKAELEQFKNDMPILGVEETKITDAVHKRGVEILGGKQSNAYSDRSLRGKLYSDLHRELRRQFDVSTYKAIKRSQCSTAISIIKDYKPPLALAEQIKNLNAQMNMDMGVA